MDKILKEEQIQQVAKEFGVDQAAIKAVKEVESKGSGFLPSGRPIILFEGHIFWRELVNNKKNPKDYLSNNQDIIYPTFDRSHYKGGEKEYDRLNRAIAIDRDAALKSASFGLFQIMGFNYKLAGYDTVEHYVAAQQESELNQLTAFVNFVKNTKLIEHLKTQDWAAFAKGYNGAQYAQNQYDVKLKAAFTKFYVAPKVEAPVAPKVEAPVAPKVEAPAVKVFESVKPTTETKVDTTKVVNPKKIDENLA